MGAQAPERPAGRDGNQGLLAQRLRSQLLAGPPARRPEAAVERLLAVQAQDPRGMRLALRARTKGLTVSDLDDALTSRRSLLVAWLNRGTLHLVRREDFYWLHALTAPRQLAGNTRRLRQEGVSEAAAELGVKTIVRVLEREGPLLRSQLVERLDAVGVPTAGQAFIHVLALASLRGLTVRGPTIDGSQAHVLTHDWLGPAPHVDRDAALAELARRYLAGHEPAEDRDLAKWSGLPLGDARAGLRAIEREVRQRSDGLLELAAKGATSASRLPAPRLLGPFEPVLLGWASRRQIAGAHPERLIAVNGLIRPIALVGGVAAGAWKLAAGVLRLEPFEKLSAGDLDALTKDAAALERYLGVPARMVVGKPSGGLEPPTPSLPWRCSTG